MNSYLDENQSQGLEDVFWEKFRNRQDRSKPDSTESAGEHGRTDGSGTDTDGSDGSIDPTLRE